MQPRLHSNTFGVIGEILNAPIGKIMSVLEESLKCAVNLNIIEQNSIGRQFVRKVSISVMGVPLIRATVTFDSKRLPDFILHDILMRKSTIGDILEKHGIDATRRVKALRQKFNGKRIFREYEIVRQDMPWFVIREEIDTQNLQTVLEENRVCS